MTDSKKNSSKKNSKKCSRGMILREGYTTKKGSKVPASCITAQSDSGKKTSIKLKKYLQKKAKMHREAMKRFSKEVPKKCSKGEILREGFKKNIVKLVKILMYLVVGLNQPVLKVLQENLKKAPS